MVTSLTDQDIHKEVLGLGCLDQSDVNKTISFVEAKEMTLDEMTQPSITASVFSYNSQKKYKKKNQIVK